MYNKKQLSKPLFAEVQAADGEIRQPSSSNDHQRRDQRIPYIKLSYSIGVTLILPTSVDMRKQFQGLQGIVNEEFGRYLTQDEAFVFIGKTLKTAKILHRERKSMKRCFGRRWRSMMRSSGLHTLI